MNHLYDLILEASIQHAHSDINKFDLFAKRFEENYPENKALWNYVKEIYPDEIKNQYNENLKYAQKLARINIAFSKKLALKISSEHAGKNIDDVNLFLQILESSYPPRSMLLDEIKRTKLDEIKKIYNQNLQNCNKVLTDKTQKTTNENYLTCDPKIMTIDDIKKLLKHFPYKDELI